MSELTKSAKLALIYRHTHNDYKGKDADGVRRILVLREGGTNSVPLDALTDEEIADKLPSAMRKEGERKAKPGRVKTYNEHTPGPWFYSSGAVWADADEKIGVAQRISTSPIPAYQRDNNMRLCAGATDMEAALLDIATHAATGNPLTADALARIAHATLVKIGSFKP